MSLQFFASLGSASNNIILTQLVVTGGIIYVKEDQTNTASFDVTLKNPQDIDVLMVVRNGFSTIDQDKLVFTTGNFNVPQTVTITGKVNTPNGVKYDFVDLTGTGLNNTAIEFRVVDSNIDSSIYNKEPLTDTHWSTIADLNTLRSNTIDWVFGTGYGNSDGVLPTESITNFTTFAGDSFVDITGLSNFSSAESGSIIMGSGSDWTVHLYKFISTTDNNKWFIVPTGHGDDWTGPGDTNAYELLINNLLSNGYNVIFNYMCGRGPNSTEAGIPQGSGGRPGTHDAMDALENPSPFFNPFEYFLKPSIVAINYVNNQTPDNIYMTGISGGGWLSTWIHFLDPRIEKAFDVAGGYPNYIRAAYRVQSNDYEQGHDDPGDAPDRSTTFVKDQYARVSYSDMYCGAAQNGEHYQFNNINDSCCFDGFYNTVYKTELKKKLGSIGVWDAFAYNEPGQHTYTQIIIDQILALL